MVGWGKARGRNVTWESVGEGVRDAG